MHALAHQRSPASRGTAPAVTTIRGVTAAFVLAGLAACSPYTNIPDPVAGAYAGPPISAEALLGEHILVASVPAPGFEFTLDGTREAFRSENVFVTLRRPNPAVLYTQEPVTLRLATGISAAVKVKVYARVLEYGDREGPGHQEALEIAGSSEASPN